MIGIFVILIVSYLLLHFIENKNLLALGILPLPKVMAEFAIGFVFIIFITLTVIGLDSWFMDIQWQANSEIDYQMIGMSLWYYLKSAITEDLVFRGAILYILVSKLGMKTGILLSASVFGVYHWFSYGLLLGEYNYIALLYIFIITGSAGFVWAYAYIKTGSIMMPLGFHLGSNFIFGLFYKNEPYGELIFSQLSMGQLSNDYIELIYLLAKGLFAPLITWIFIKWWTKANED